MSGEGDKCWARQRRWRAAAARTSGSGNDDRNQLIGNSGTMFRPMTGSPTSAGQRDHDTFDSTKSDFRLLPVPFAAVEADFTIACEIIDQD
jgi:hypothetical protein